MKPAGKTTVYTADSLTLRANPSGRFYKDVTGFIAIKTSKTFAMAAGSGFIGFDRFRQKPDSPQAPIRRSDVSS
jgi:hypothetical protein